MKTELLRHVTFDGYQLKLWDTDRPDSRLMGHTYLGYQLISPEGNIIFDGDDLGVPPFSPIDSDSTLRTLLGFLTVRPGDVEDEYFADYTLGQMDFVEGDAEALSIWALDEELEGCPRPEFTEVEE